MKNKVIVAIIVIAVIIAGWYIYTNNVKAKIESPSGFGSWGQEILVEYMDGTVEPMNILRQPLSVYHNGKEVVALRYRLSTNVDGNSATATIDLSSYNIRFPMGTNDYTLSFIENTLVVPSGSWFDLINKRILIENITGSLPENTYELNVIPQGIITYTINNGQQKNAILPIAVKDNFVIAESSINCRLMISAYTYGTTSPAPGSYEYTPNSNVVCRAIPNNGYHFTGWTGSYTGNSNPYTIIMDTDKTLVAHFEINTTSYNLIISASSGGTTNPAPGTYSYTPDSSVICTANPLSGYHFDAWIGDYTGTQNPYTIMMNGNKQLTANFVINTPNYYTLVVNINGQGAVTKNPDNTQYAESSQVQLTATPALGWQFDSWSGSIAGNQNPTTIVMNGNKVITATFIQIQYALSISITGTGTVTKTPDQATYTYGATVELNAVPSPSGGYVFDHWSGDLTGNANPTTITITKNTVITATFILPQSQYFVHVLTPNGGENWVVGFTNLISWSCNFTAPVKIELYKNNVFNLLIIASAPNDGSYSWTIPDGQTPGTDYKIKITLVSDATVYDNSDNNFIISNPVPPQQFLDLSTFELVNENPTVTSYVISDGLGTNSKITITNLNYMNMDQDFFLRKDFGTGYFGHDFTIEYTSTIISLSGTAGWAGCLGLTNASYIRSLHDGFYMPGGHTVVNPNANGLSTGYWNNVEADLTNIKATGSWFCHGGTDQQYYYGFPGTVGATHYFGPHYFRLTRTGHSFSVYLYTDASRTTLSSLWATNPAVCHNTTGFTENQVFNYMLVGYGRGAWGTSVSYSLQDVVIVSH
jgi:uncharacterized repeat protein (TIGR02543 family)